MTLTREIKPGVLWVGAIDWDRRLFDALITLPRGTSYNSYLIRGSEKTALIDAVDATMAGVLIANLRSLGIEKIDYIICQHAEQDHSGTVSELVKLFPDAKLLGTSKCLDLLREFGLISGDKGQEVKDGDSIALGGKTLQFIHAPWVHWPDTMFTYLPEDRIAGGGNHHGRQPARQAHPPVYGAAGYLSSEGARETGVDVILAGRFWGEVTYAHAAIHARRSCTQAGG